MKHKAQVSTFGRKSNARRALIRGLLNSLVEHGRIKTTVAKAKELRRHAERAVTLARKNTLHARRLLLSRYPHPQTVDALVGSWGPHFAKRPGGYTRVLKLGNRTGDAAEMAVIEFLDFDKVVSLADKEAKATGTKAKGAKKKAATKKAPAKKAAKKAKSEEA